MRIANRIFTFGHPIVHSFKTEKMRIPDEIVRQIQQAADVIEVVGDYVSLKKKGSNWTACCPFHNEKTPSFAVSPAKGIYKCFGCGKAGDSIKFIMDIEGLSYGEALRHLAKKYNIEIPEVEYTPEETLRQNGMDSLYIVLNFAKDFYKKQLQTPDGQAIGLSYFKERGLRDSTIEAFDLGYSVSAWDAFTKEALSKQYNLELLHKAGLSITNESGRTYDRFRDRVVFPIHNLSGKTIAFGARIMTADKNQPKYLNSPETDVYHKSRILYGIHQAKNAIRTADNCYLVEGYMDVVSLYQAGIQNVVASSGTSLTKEQIQLISRFTKNITMLYDGDNAGIKAAIRGTDLVLEEGMNVKIVTFPDNDDPDSYVQKVGTVAFQEFVKQKSQDFVLFKTQFLTKEIQNDPQKKASVVQEILETMTKVPEQMQREDYCRLTAEILKVEQQSLISALNSLLLKKSKEKASKIKNEEHKPPTESPVALAGELPEGVVLPDAGKTAILSEIDNLLRPSISYKEEGIVRLLFNYADRILDGTQDTVCDYVMREMEDISFQTPVYQRILADFRENWQQGKTLTGKDFMDYQDPEIQRLAVDMMIEKYTISENWFGKFDIHVPHESENLMEEAHSQVLRLKQEVVKGMLAENQKAIAAATSFDEQMQLLRVQKQYKELEKQIADILGNVVR